MPKIVCRDVMELNATPEQILDFVLTAERIADYFPDVIDCGTFEQGKAVWCSGKSGVSLLELDESQSTPTMVVTKVYNALGLKPPYTQEAIKARPFMTMVEDWEVEAIEGGTRLTKTWRDVVKHKMKWLPMGMMIRRTAKKERADLIAGWNRAAQQST